MSPARRRRRGQHACAYPLRWGAETVIGHHETELGVGIRVVRSKDPEGVTQEVLALLAIYQAIRP